MQCVGAVFFILDRCKMKYDYVENQTTGSASKYHPISATTLFYSQINKSSTQTFLVSFIGSFFSVDFLFFCAICSCFFRDAHNICTTREGKSVPIIVRTKTAFYQLMPFLRRIDQERENKHKKNHCGDDMYKYNISVPVRFMYTFYIEDRHLSSCMYR